MNPSLAPQFSKPEEEIAFLREQITRKEQELASRPEKISTPEVVRAVVEQYKAQPKEQVLHPSVQVSEQHANAIVLALEPKSTDEKMAELLSILIEKGLKNTLSVLEKINNPSLDDDFHRFLVQYLASGQPLPRDFKKQDVFKGVDMVLYEITVPDIAPTQNAKSFKELVAVMEQLYAGMMSLSDGKDNEIGKNYFTFEIALSNNSDSIVFYAAVPRKSRDLFEKQLTALYPAAHLSECKNDYNIFNDSGASFATYAVTKETPALPIKTYDQFESDPIQVILNAFSKLKHTGEGAAVQFVIRPAGEKFIKRYGKLLDKVRAGMTLGEAVKEEDSLYYFGKKALNFFASPQEKPEKTSVSHVEEDAIKYISEKIRSTICDTNIRIVASAETTDRAKQIISDLSSSFQQFTETKGNALLLQEIKGRENLKLFREFSYRVFNDGESVPLNIRELTTLFHFPEHAGNTTSQLKTARATIAPAPLDLPQGGTLLGVNSYRNIDTKVYMTPDDRVRHFYVIGQTGTGKTSILKNMIMQDIAQGHGCCFIDPHGTDVVDILANIPKERIDDVIYFDPSYTERPMGLNMLEFDPRYPEQKTFVVDELLNIFNKLFDMKVAGGPAFEQYFRNSALLVMEDPESGNTLLDIARVLSDKAYRELKLSKCKNPIVLQFWQNALRTTGDQGLQNYVPYITNKFDVFLSNEIMRPVVSQAKSAFNFREVMDNKKILLVNLAKGRLGEINANLIGLILVGKIQMAALSRVDMYGQKMNDFYLYIDEFQNVTTDSIASILSEARKYRLSLNIAHQYIAQLPENIKNAVFGNVGSLAVFRVGADDAKYLETQLAPVFTQADILKLENYNAYLKLLARGVPQKPFNIVTYPPSKGNQNVVEQLKQLSYLTYGRDRREVEAEIVAKYQG